MIITMMFIINESIDLYLINNIIQHITGNNYPKGTGRESTG